MPPKPVTEQDLAEAEAEKRGYARGYEQGYAAAKAEAKPPLFEAAKKIAEGFYYVTEPELDARLGELEAEYGERISRADRGLLASLAKRLRMAEEVQRQAFLQVNRPKSKAGKRVAERISEQRAETVYETVN